MDFENKPVEFSEIETMPMLPLRGISVFPGMLLNFDVERMMSVMALNAALLPAFIQVKYLDAIDGVTTRTFYGSAVEAATLVYIDGETHWSSTAFDLIER